MEKPALYEDLDFEVILEEKIKRFTRSYQREYPEFETPTIVDPVYHALSEIALTDLLIKKRINGSIEALLLKWSHELDHLSYLKRAPDETMDEFREKLRLNMASASPAGTSSMYESLAILHGVVPEAKVLDAKAVSEGDEVVIYLLSSDKSGKYDRDLMEKVTAYFQLEDSKPALDKVAVRMAIKVPITVSAVFSLESGASANTLDKIKENFRKEWALRTKLDWNPSLSWIIKTLHTDNVYSVDLKSPVRDIKLEPNQYPNLDEMKFE